MTDTPQYYIASLNHTHRHHEHIVWWGPNQCGYTPVVGDYIGRYDAAEAATLNDGEVCLAVPVEAVQALLLAEPVLSSGSRFYDQRGPVVNNERANWTALLAARLAEGRTPGVKPKPEVFRGKRRALQRAALADGQPT